MHSGPWILPEFFSGRITLREWFQYQSFSESEERVLRLKAELSRFLSKLVEKELIVEEMADP